MSNQPSPPRRVTYADLANIRLGQNKRLSAVIEDRTASREPVPTQVGSTVSTHAATQPSTQAATQNGSEVSTQEGISVGGKSTPVSTQNSAAEAVVSTRPSTQQGRLLDTQPSTNSVYPLRVDTLKRQDTRAQLNLKISMEVMFALKEWCDLHGVSQKQAVESAIGLLTGRGVPQCLPARLPISEPQRLPAGVDVIRSEDDDVALGSFEEKTNNIIVIYREITKNEWSPADQNCLRVAFSEGLSPTFIEIGILKAAIYAKSRVNSFAYCLKTARSVVAEGGETLGDGTGYLAYVRDFYRRHKAKIEEKQRVGQGSG